jgi:hypothetical protein
MSRKRQECGEYPIVAVPVLSGGEVSAIDDRYLDTESLGLLRDLRLRRLAEGTGPVRILDHAGVITISDEDNP